jgi:hypothetical protein
MKNVYFEAHHHDNQDGKKKRPNFISHPMGLNANLFINFL